MTPHALMLKKASNGALIEAAASDTGELKISGTLAAPEGVATEAKQDAGNASLTSIDGKLAALSGGRMPVVLAATPLPTGAATSALQGGGLPAALGAGGGLKIDGSGTALPVSAASLPLPTGAATSALQGGGLPAALHGGLGLKTGVLDSAGAEVFPAVGAIGSANVAVNASVVGAYMLGYDSNNSRWRRPYVDSSDRLAVATTPASATTTSRSAGTYEVQRGIDFAFSLWQLIVFSETAGYILLVNKASDAVDTDVPYGANVYPIAANQTIEIGALGSGTYENFSSGCQVVFSSTKNVVTLGGAHILASIKGV